MEVNVTCLLTGSFDPSDLSGSIAERGPDAAQETWRNSRDAARMAKLRFDRDAARAFFADFGAWSRDELNYMSDSEISALVLQYAAHDLRELQDLCPGDGLGDIDWTEAERLAAAGTVSGALYAAGDDLMIYIGN